MRHRGSNVFFVLLLLSVGLLAPDARGQCDPGLDVEVFDAGTVAEGDSGQRKARFKVRMTQRAPGQPGGPSGPFDPVGPCSLVMAYSTRDDLGSATPGADYARRGGRLALDDERREAVVAVGVLGDRDSEQDEDFFLTISLVSVESGGDGQGGPVLVRDTARAVIADDDEVRRLEVVGEDARVTRVGDILGIAVRVRGADGRGVPDQPVDWLVVEGRAVFDPGAPGGGGTSARSFTARDGVARRPIQVSEPGVVRVRASLPATDLAVEMTLDAEGDLGDLPEPSSGPADVGDVVDDICREADGVMGDFCEYVFSLPDPDQRAVLEAVTPRQAAAVGNLVIHSGQTQVDTLADRLRSRRRAAAGSAEDGGGEAGARAARGDRFDLRLAGPAWPAPRLAALGRTGPGVSGARHLDSESAWADALARSVTAVQDEAVQVDEPVAVSATTEPSAEPGYDVEAPSRLGFFASGRYSSGDRYSTYDEAGFDADVVGVTAGLDYLVGSRAVLGAAVGWLDTGADFFARAGELDGQSWSLSAYGTVFSNPAFSDTSYLEMVLTGGRNDFTQRRGIELPVPFAGADRYVATADLEGDQWGVTLTAGADRAFGALTLEGFLRGSWVEATFDAYRERGAGPFNLAVGEQTVESLQGEAGVGLSYAASYGWGVLQSQVRASWLHEFEDDVRLIRGRFVEDVQALELVIPTEVRDADFANAGAGLTATFAGGRSLYVFYDRDLSRDGLEMENLTFGVRLEL